MGGFLVSDTAISALKAQPWPHPPRLNICNPLAASQVIDKFMLKYLF